MLLNEKEILIPKVKNHDGLLKYVSDEVLRKLALNEMPVRFVITCTDNEGYHCELGILSNVDDLPTLPESSIFDFKKRNFENTDQFNAVLIVPTGIGAEIGGHSGDAGPVARLLAAACDNLITHPNVVNAADINEYPENALYVEGSVLSRLLMGTVGLQKVRSNRVMLVIDKHHDKFFHEAAINSASAARAAFGLDCPLVVKMANNVLMRSLYSSSGRAVGRIEYFEQLCKILKEYRQQYDAVALSSLIEVPSHFHEDYFRQDIGDMVNPWGGVEAMLTHAISLLFDIPSAHSPMTESKEILNLDVGVVDPRKSAEAISTTYLHCILKGLHRSPRIINNPSIHSHSGLLTVVDISCLVIPDGCVGLPTLAALEQGIPVISVKENKNRMQNKLEELPFAPGKLFVVDNYLEAVGVMNAIKAGVAPESVRRPLAHTTVREETESQESKPLEKMITDDLTR
ncbi:MAG: DUF3326 domain-containing protein [Dehalococcoidia bacterium]